MLSDKKSQSEILKELRNNFQGQMKKKGFVYSKDTQRLEKIKSF